MHFAQETLVGVLKNGASFPAISENAEIRSCWKPICWRSATPDREVLEDIAAFKERYRFAFPAEPAPISYSQPAMQEFEPREEFSRCRRGTGSYFDALPEDDEVPAEILEFFQPEAEEHLQIVSDCLLSLEANHSPEEINKLFVPSNT